MWQRAKQGKLHWNDPYWYDKVRVGREPLERFLGFLSEDIQLSKRYTNHSIRSTAMGILGDKFEGREVIFWSGHKSESTIKQYVKRIPAKKKREMCAELAANILPKVPKRKADETISIPPKDLAHVPQQAENNFINIPLDNNDNNANNQPEMQLILEELNAPIDPQLENFLKNFDPVQAPDVQPQNPQPIANPLHPPNQLRPVLPPPPLAPQQLNMNVNNIQNNPNRFMPAMYFPSSNVTINYNFGK